MVVMTVWDAPLLTVYVTTLLPMKAEVEVVTVVMVVLDGLAVVGEADDEAP